jgi:hypothetical protein
MGHEAHEPQATKHTKVTKAIGFRFVFFVIFVALSIVFLRGPLFDSVPLRFC